MGELPRQPQDQPEEDPGADASEQLTPSPDPELILALESVTGVAREHLNGLLRDVRTLTAVRRFLYLTNAVADATRVGASREQLYDAVLDGLDLHNPGGTEKGVAANRQRILDRMDPGFRYGEE